MTPEEERNLCPDCRALVPLGAPRCPQCGRRFHPQHSNLFTLYWQCWALWNKCSGRASLPEFHAFALPHTLLFLWSCFYLANRLGARPWEENGWASIPAAFEKEPLFYVLYAFFALTLVPGFSLCCRRVHDSDRDFGDMRDEAADMAEEAYYTTPWGYRLPSSVRRMMELPDVSDYVLFPLLERIRLFVVAIISFIVHLPHLLFMEDSSPGPNRFGPATRYLHYQDGPIPRNPFH